jgi:hypothetical protein
MNNLSRSGAAVRIGTASTYDGFFLRDNLASDGVVPAGAPYNQCPDIIQSPTPIPDPLTTLSTLASWDRMYRTEPAAGTNYYYARGLNGKTDGTFDGQMSLFWAPAELILFPSLWKNNPLQTSSGKETVNVSAAAGHIGVGEDPWVLRTPASSNGSSTFTSFIAQNLAGSIPTISDWIDMSTLMTQQLNFGWRNAVTFDPAGNGGMMLHRMGLTIPGTVGQQGTLLITLSANGFVGDTVSLIADRYTPEQQPLQIQPTKISQNGGMIGIQANLDPGFLAHLTVQYWNTSDHVPAAGSTLTLTASYLVPETLLARAISAGVVDSRVSQMVARQFNIHPQAVAPLGAVTFIAGPSGS